MEKVLKHMNKKDYARLRELENFAEYVASALTTRRNFGSPCPAQRNAAGYLQSLDRACIQGIQRAVNKVKNNL